MRPKNNLFILEYRLLKGLLLVGGWLILIGGCHPNHKKEKNQNSKQQKEPIESEIFLVGDLTNNQITDTAFVFSKYNKANEFEKEETWQVVTIEFSGNISPLTIENSLGVFISKTEDLNQDNANELLLFSRTNQGWWNALYVFSYHEGKWSKLAETQAFISEPEDFEHRIKKVNGQYYVLGDNKWEEDENGRFKKIKIKIPNQ